MGTPFILRTPLEGKGFVINRVEIASEDDYKAALAEHNARASRHEEDRVKELPYLSDFFWGGPICFLNNLCPSPVGI